MQYQWERAYFSKFRAIQSWNPKIKVFWVRKHQRKLGKKQCVQVPQATSVLIKALVGL